MSRPSKMGRLWPSLAELLWLVAVATSISSLSCEGGGRSDSAYGIVQEIGANPSAGFSFPYLLWIPPGIDATRETHLLVEPNNTGKATDDFEVHRRAALSLASDSYANRLAKSLGVPLLVPVFPRSRTQGDVYTQALDRDTLEIAEGPLKRIDVQLVAMIDHAIGELRASGLKVDDRVFLDGFSASGNFCNRFVFLHPERVKAVAAGGVNGLPTLPIASRNGLALPFPIGIADIDRFTGLHYEDKALAGVAQYVYMGYLDSNDTLPYRDAWNENEAATIKTAIAATMMPERWAISRAVYREHLPHAQCVTYNGVGHEIKDDMIQDLVHFFQENSGDTYAAIAPHEYEFVERVDLRRVHIVSVYAEGDPRIPDWVKSLPGPGVFFFVVKEWSPEEDHKQLNGFVEKAGFRFRLQCEGHPDVVVAYENWRGNVSEGTGRFQAQCVKLSEEQLDRLANGIPYRLIAENENEQYMWIVEDGVTLTKPITRDESVPVEKGGHTPTDDRAGGDGVNRLENKGGNKGK